MSKPVTIADVATLAGVHKATVSRALNAKTQHQVNSQTIRRVRKAAKQLGYVPNVMARGLRTNLSMTIGVVIPDLTNPLFPPIIRGIENFLSPRGYTALLANTDGREALERAAIDSLLERRVDGLVIATGLENHPILPALHERGVMAVMVNRSAGNVPYPLVTGNDVAGMTMAVDHLYALGHRNILHVAGPRNFSTSRTRAEAVLRAAEDHGMVCELATADAMRAEEGERVINEVLARERGFTAIVASNDLLALGALRSLRAHGISCPGDVSVTGFNDMPFAEDFNPGLTTVRIPQREIGTESARILLSNIEAGTQDPVTVTLPVSLIVRASTARART